MIRYDFLAACENCPHLCATSLLEYEVESFPNFTTYHHIVTCENIHKCRQLLEHLQKEE